MTYNEIVPPFSVGAFENMTKKQAEQYLNWYIDTMEERLSNLEEYIHTTGTYIELDKSIESLIPLWEWFYGQIEINELSEEEIRLALQGKPEWMHKHILNDRNILSKNTQMLVYDVSAYLGEVIIKHNPSIYWGCLTKPKQLHGVNKPRLLGFNMNMDIYLYGKVYINVWKSLKEYNNMRLYNLYNLCIEKI